MRAMGQMLRGTIALTACVILGVGIAQAEVLGGANVRASLDGWLTPHTLPRSALVPVALHMRGAVTTSDGREPPQLERVTIAINRNGEISTVGLPVCPKRLIEATTTAEALAACGKALVGNGSFTAHLAFPTQAPFPAQGRLLAFNSVVGGRQVILAHIYGTDPVPTSRVLELKFQPPSPGAFGVTLSMKMPEFGERWGYATGFSLTLRRRYTYLGQQRSLIRASCPAPKGFTVAFFAAAKGTYYLADGRQISRVLHGSCKVRR
jgi:hypothetical protein